MSQKLEVGFYWAKQLFSHRDFPPHYPLIPVVGGSDWEVVKVDDDPCGERLVAFCCGDECWYELDEFEFANQIERPNRQ